MHFPYVEQREWVSGNVTRLEMVDRVVIIASIVAFPSIVV
jgi:hypothetical protein